MKSEIRKMRSALVLLAVTTLVGSGSFWASANAVTPPSSETAKKQSPPPALPPRPLQLPKPVTYKLANGLKVVLLEDHRVPFVTFEIGIKSGDTCDPKGLPGLAKITADMVTEGTEKRSSKQIADEVDRIGAAMKASADPDFTIVSGSGLSKHASDFFDLISDVVEHPSFPEDELKLEKTNLIQELNMKRSNPSFLADERFHKVLFGDHPYSVVAPTADSVEHLTRSDLENFHKANYLPNNSSLVVVGDFQLDTMKKIIEKDFGGWQSGKLLQSDLPICPARTGKLVCLVDRPGSVQSCVKLGNIGIKKNDPDYFAVMVANQVLGGSANSRLFLNIREQKGYTYGAYSSFSPRVDRGSFAASADVRTPVTAPSLKEFLYELARIRTTPVTDAELTSAKNYLVGSFQTSFETQGSLAQRLMELQLYNLPDDYLSTYTDKVMAVTPADVERVASKHIDVNNLAITVVGDAKQIETDLRSFAPVDVYDQNGKLLRSDDVSKTGNAGS